VDAGAEYIEQTSLIGTTTNADGTPDSNKIDLGFHHANWGYGENYLIRLWDFDESGEIDILDLRVFSEYWLEPFDFYDFVSFASQWRQTEQRLTPDVQMVFNKDSNSLNGFVQIGVNVFDPNMYRLFVLMDGEKYTEIDDLDSLTTGIQTDSFFNGNHSFKVVRVENNGNIICSGPYDVNFSNEISNITADSGYSPDRGYSFYAFGSAGVSYNAEIKDLVNDSVIYSADFNDNISLKAAASIFTEPYHIYSVVIKRNWGSEFSSNTAMEETQQVFAMTATDDSTDEIVKRIMAKKFNPNIIDGGVKMVVSVGSGDINDRDITTVIPAIIKAAVIKQINPQYLPYEDCTWKNLSCLLKDYPCVTYWYHDSHGSYQIPVLPSPDPNHPIIAQRTHIMINKDIIFSRLRRDYGTNVPSNYQDLGLYEYFSHSIAELGFENNPKLKYIRMNSCFSARYPDFAVAAGIIGGEPYYNPLGERIYIGWNDVSWMGDWYRKWGIVPIATYYETFEIGWFYQQSVGCYSVGQAALEAVLDQPLLVRHILWNGAYPNIKIWGANSMSFYLGQ
jgi:hypothetical protein